MLAVHDQEAFMTRLVLPGLVDIHVHLRQPGAGHKEDILSGTTAALAGGMTLVLDMPNTLVPTITLEALDQKRRLFEASAVCDYGFFAGYMGGALEPLLAIAPQAIGLKLYLDETFGDMTLEQGVGPNARSLEQVFEAWPGPGPIAVHGDAPTVERVLALGQRYGQALHVCHVPHPDVLLAIDRARQAGAAVSCEVTPHHLLLSTEDLPRLGPFGIMKPALLTPDLVQRFWERMDLVDAIASDHAPHTVAEKEWRRNGLEQPPPGVPGLETTLPLMLRAVDEGRLTQERLVGLLHDNPLRIYGLAPDESTHVVVELDEAYRLPFAGYRTRCGWSPFVDKWALGRVVEVALHGQAVWRDGRLLAAAGSGRWVHRAPDALG
jgi:dihydroorotase